MYGVVERYQWLHSSESGVHKRFDIKKFKFSRKCAVKTIKLLNAPLWHPLIWKWPSAKSHNNFFLTKLHYTFFCCPQKFFKVFSIVSVFTSNYPARTCYEVGNLPIRAVVEIEVIAMVGEVKIEIVNADTKL